MDKTKLTAKQDKFVKSYLLNGGNATQAAIDAGYKADNAAVVGCENLTKPNIKAEIDKHRKMANEKFTISIEQRLEWLKEVAEAGLTIQEVTKGEDKVKQRENLPAVTGAVRVMNEMLGTDQETAGAKPVKVIIGVQDAS